MLHALSTIANLSAYLDIPENVLALHAVRITAAIMPLLVDANIEIMCEASRILGNLTQLEEVVSYFVNNRGARRPTK